MSEMCPHDWPLEWCHLCKMKAEKVDKNKGNTELLGMLGRLEDESNGNR